MFNVYNQTIIKKVEYFHINSKWKYEGTIFLSFDGVLDSNISPLVLSGLASLPIELPPIYIP